MGKKKGQKAKKEEAEEAVAEQPTTAPQDHDESGELGAGGVQQKDGETKTAEAMDAEGLTHMVREGGEHEEAAPSFGAGVATQHAGGGRTAGEDSDAERGQEIAADPGEGEAASGDGEKDSPADNSQHEPATAAATAATATAAAPTTTSSNSSTAPAGPSLFSPELPSSLTRGLLANMLPTIDMLAQHLQELSSTQKTLLAGLQAQHHAFAQNLDIRCINDTLALIPTFTARLTHVRADMIAIHRKAQNLQKRANALRARREQADAAAQAAREREAARERSLVARPAPNASVRT